MKSNSLTRLLSGPTLAWVLAVGLAVSNLLLVRQNLALRNRIERMSSSAFPIGYSVPPLRGLNENGEEVSTAFDA